ncbi:MAG: hypothetical protein HY886_10470 [Deltaproteobacteria bacterium]|nr:hypothetical protein [Deltaproteobacteria bacterium]
MRGAVILLIAALLLYGCAGTEITAPPPVGPAGAFEAIAMKAIAVVSLNNGAGVTLKGRAILLAKKPGLFRIEVTGPFNQTVALIVGDGKNLHVNALSGAPFYGSADPFAMLPFRSDEFVSLLLGSVADEAVGKHGTNITNDESGRPARVVMSIPGLDAWAMLEEFKETAGAHIPHTISLVDAGKRLDIRLVAVEINPANLLVDNAFFVIGPVN